MPKYFEVLFSAKPAIVVTGYSSLKDCPVYGTVHPLSNYSAHLLSKHTGLLNKQGDLTTEDVREGRKKRMQTYIHGFYMVFGFFLEQFSSTEFLKVVTFFFNF